MTPKPDRFVAPKAGRSSVLRALRGWALVDCAASYSTGGLLTSGRAVVTGAVDALTDCPIGPDGCWSIQAPRSKAGDYIDLRAEMDVLVAFSNCPQIHNACNAFRRKPLGALIYQFEAS